MGESGDWTSAADAARFFDAVARRYDRVYALPREASRRRMARLCEVLPQAPARVLDLGVGTGRELSALQDAGHAIVGLDISEEMLAICARRARPIATVLGDLWSPLPFADASFDAVIALHGTLAHPPGGDAPAQLAHEARRVLRPGGVFVFEVPRATWLEGGSQRGPAGDAHAVGGARVVHRDEVTGATLGATLLPVEAWLLACSAVFDARAEPLDDAEVRIVAVT